MVVKKSLAVFIILFAGVTAALTAVLWPFIRSLGNPAYREGFKAWMESLGYRGAAILFGLQAAQIVAAVIPGGPVELIAGAAYGALGGTGICLAGSFFAGSLIFFMMKKFGLPLAARFFPGGRIRRWSFLGDAKRRSLLIFILFIIPGTPKDLLSYLAPLSGVSYGEFIILSNLARTPAILCTAIMGDSLIRGNWVMVVGIFLLTALTGILGIGLRDRIVKKAAGEGAAGGNCDKRQVGFKTPKSFETGPGSNDSNIKEAAGMMKRALTIAGSDCSGGAGIQADLKTFSAHGVFGMSVIVSVVAENTSRVIGWQDIEPGMIRSQIDAIYEDIGTDAVKIGMLSTASIMETVAEKLLDLKPANVVADPVMYAKNGAPLMERGAIGALIKNIIPLADLITPNIPEAEELARMTIKNTGDMQRAAESILAMGARAVLIKGGHGEGAEESVDILFDGKDSYPFGARRIPTKNTHGTGCTLSSAIAANLALGLPLKEAVGKAKAYVTTAIEHALELGKGPGPTHHFWDLYRRGLGN